MKLLLALSVLLAPLLSCCKELINPLDCSDIRRQDGTRPSGVYTIFPFGERSAVQVYCDMETEGGGWTVFQRRMDGSLNFYRPWTHYKKGFGNASGEYWLSLDIINFLTQRKSELRIDMMDFEGKEVFAYYSFFKVEAECDGYRLTVSGFSNGGAGDSLVYHNQQKFSTYDKDLDGSSGNCAEITLGAFWHKDCSQANPNGVYRWGVFTTYSTAGVIWHQWKGSTYSLRAISMKLRFVP